MTDNKLADALRDIQQYLQMTAPSPDCGHLLQITVDALAEHDASPQPNPKGGDAFLGEMIGARAVISGVVVPPAPAPVKPPANGESNEHVALLQELLRAYGDSGFSEERAAFRAAIAALQQKVTTPALPEVTDEDVAAACEHFDVWRAIVKGDKGDTSGRMLAALKSYRARLMAKAVPND